MVAWDSITVGNARFPICDVSAHPDHRIDGQAHWAHHIPVVLTWVSPQKSTRSLGKAPRRAGTSRPLLRIAPRCPPPPDAPMAVVRRPGKHMPTGQVAILAMATEHQINRRIADAVLTARQMGLATAREAAEFSAGGPIHAETWEAVREMWERHFALPIEELRHPAHSRLSRGGVAPRNSRHAAA
jgi:hypothetical protein